MTEPAARTRRVFALVRLHGLSAAVEARSASPRAARAGAIRTPIVLCDESGQRVISASPDAMRRGVRPGQSLWEAQRRCPDVAVAEADSAKYQYHWQRAVEICGDYSPDVRYPDPLSLSPRGERSSARRPATETVSSSATRHDISLDLTGTERLFGPARNVAQEIRNRLRVEVGVLASIGLGPNRMVALLAADSAQPGDITEVFADEAVEFVGDLPVFALPGVDPDRISRLGQLGIRHARDLAKLPPDAVERALGDWGRRLWDVANGNDPDAAGDTRSLSARPALPAVGGPDDYVSGEADLHPPSDVRERIYAALRLAAEQASRALRHQGQVGRQVAIELVFRDFRVVGARRTLRQPTRSNEVVFYAARDLLDKIRRGDRLVRRLRVRVARLTTASDGGQLPLPLLEREARRERLAEMVERVRDRFGKTALQRASAAELIRR
jgi:DNA polymerase-4